MIMQFIYWIFAIISFIAIFPLGRFVLFYPINLSGIPGKIIFYFWAGIFILFISGLIYLFFALGKRKTNWAILTSIILNVLIFVGSVIYLTYLDSAIKQAYQDMAYVPALAGLALLGYILLALIIWILVPFIFAVIGFFLGKKKKELDKL